MPVTTCMCPATSSSASTPGPLPSAFDDAAIERLKLAAEEDVDVIGVSILSGAHMTVFPRILEALKARDAQDIVVVGGGVAGLYAALCAADEADVLLLAKGPAAASNSWQAQGGVAAALGEDDSPGLHADDTVRAGRGLCRESAVRTLLTTETIGSPDATSARIALMCEMAEFRSDAAAGGAATSITLAPWAFATPTNSTASAPSSTFSISVSSETAVEDAFQLSPGFTGRGGSSPGTSAGQNT